MTTIHLLRADGSSHPITATDGASAMQALTAAGEPGIVAECGGSAICATCHVYVDEAWQQRLPAPLPAELDALEGVVAERRPASRLSCQIMMSSAFDGLQLQLPACQV